MDHDKKFKQAYPGEAAVLLQRFMTGLQPAISHQLLLMGQPDSLDKAIQQVTEVE